MTVEHIGGTAPLRRLDVVLTGLSSDAHTWNLVYLELLLEEMGCRVTNLGACTPDVTIVRACATRRPNLLVVSSLNGHGVQDGVRLIRALRAEPGLVALPAVIGGRLDATGGTDRSTPARLLAAGFDAVFEDAAGVTTFRALVRRLVVEVAQPAQLAAQPVQVQPPAMRPDPDCGQPVGAR
jgi:methylaspartate mutase sigma subunit